MIEVERGSDYSDYRHYPDTMDSGWTIEQAHDLIQVLMNSGDTYDVELWQSEACCVEPRDPSCAPSLCQPVHDGRTTYSDVLQRNQEYNRQLTTIILPLWCTQLFPDVSIIVRQWHSSQPHAATSWGSLLAWNPSLPRPSLLPCQRCTRRERLVNWVCQLMDVEREVKGPDPCEK